jgi:hypothetical protein
VDEVEEERRDDEDEPRTEIGRGGADPTSEADVGRAGDERAEDLVERRGSRGTDRVYLLSIAAPSRRRRGVIQPAPVRRRGGRARRRR